MDEEIRDTFNSLTRRNRTMAQKVFGDISKRSAAQQVAIGGATGMVTGFLCMKITKVVVTSIGMSLILMQIAQHQGYIKINYKEVQQDIEKTKDRVTREANRQYPGLINNVKRFVQQNLFLAGGFAGGFLIGMAV